MWSMLLKVRVRKSNVNNLKTTEGIISNILNYSSTIVKGFVSFIENILPDEYNKFRDLVLYKEMLYFN